MSSAQKAKRSYTLSQKEQIFREHVEHGLSISAISRKHQINAVTLYAWKKMLMGSDKKKHSVEEQAGIDRLRRENEALKKTIADLAVDNAILKEANEIFKKKADHTSLVEVAKKVISGTTYSKSAIDRALGISRASIYKKTKVLQMSFYKRKDDDIYLPIIRLVLDKISSYGYKRITTLVNRILKSRGESAINRKRVYRLMKMHGLTLPKTAQIRTNREGTGKVMTMHSNTRWCSDAFEIKCFNGEEVYVAFSLDCCDREAIHFVATREPLTQKHIAELMIFSADKRFMDGRAPRKLQWLSDRGSIYRAQLTRDTARLLNMDPCYTAAYSPSSNGMAEAFVATMKRDYVYTNDCYDADMVLRMLPGWFEDYNSQAPHSALGMMNPREFIEKNNCVN